jgi:signal transduction histidine kinase
MVDHLGVMSALQRLVNECAERYGIPIAFTHASLPAPVVSEVALDGVGFDWRRLETRPSLGFVSMRERLRLVRGTIRVHSAPTSGTTIEVWVPTHGQQTDEPIAGVSADDPMRSSEALSSHKYK